MVHPEIKRASRGSREDCENAKDQVLLLVEEKKIIHLNMDKIRKENAAMNERMKHAETLVKELRRALALSKEESTILESERQRLMKENAVLTRGKYIIKESRWWWGESNIGDFQFLKCYFSFLFSFNTSDKCSALLFSSSSL